MSSFFFDIINYFFIKEMESMYAWFYAESRVGSRTSGNITPHAPTPAADIILAPKAPHHRREINSIKKPTPLT
jgi:hypothetical protein